MPLPWKKSKSGRISRFVSDLQQSPKHGGSLVVETGFPTSLIDLFVKNRDRLKKSSSKRSKATTQTAPQTPTRRVASPPPPSSSLRRRTSFSQKLDPSPATEHLAAGKTEESFVISNGGGLAAENSHDGDGENGDNRGGGGGGCVLMVVVFKVFVVTVLALSTKKLAVGITLSAFALLFLELVVTRVFTLLNLCPGAEVRIDSLIGKLMGKRRQGKIESSSSSPPSSTEIIEEIQVDQSEKKLDFEDSSSAMEKEKPVVEEEEEEKEVVVKMEKSKSSKLKSRIVKKIVPKKLRSYKKKKKLKKLKKAEEEEEKDALEEDEEGTATEVSSMYSEERIESETSERDEISSNPPLLESCEEEGEEEGEECGSKGELTKAMVLIVIVLTGLLGGKVVAICLTLSCCLILRLVSAPANLKPVSEQQSFRL